jgi:DNA-binding protein H-NS
MIESQTLSFATSATPARKATFTPSYDQAVNAHFMKSTEDQMNGQQPMQDLLAKQAEIQRQLQAVERQIKESHLAQRAEVITKIKALMAEHGLTVEDIVGNSKGRNKGKAAQRDHALAGKTVAPKYKDPSTGQTWTGRGLQPRWLKAALASGRKLEELVI